MPKVAVVSFGAPRVGNINFAKALGHRTVMDPTSMREPWRAGFWSWKSVLFWDRVIQVRLCSS